MSSFTDAVDGKNILGEIDPYGDNTHDFPLLVVDENDSFHHGTFNAVRGNFAAPSGRGSPFHSLGLPTIDRYRDMKTYQGGCHCGQVRFEIKTDLTKATECNCSICTKKGALHHRVPPDRFKLLSGQDLLSLYQFGDKTAKHWFCKVCGIHPFSNPRAAPDMYSINIRCLDTYWDEIPNIEVRLFDGKNWEDAIKTFKF